MPRYLILHVAARVELTLAPSRQLRALAILAYGFAVVLITLLLPSLRGVGLAALVLLLGMLQWRHRFSGGSPAFVDGIRHDGGGWALRFGAEDRSWQRARLVSPVFCHRHLVVLRFRCNGRWLPVSVAVTHDSCDGDDFRRLRVLARHLPAPQLWAAPR